MPAYILCFLKILLSNLFRYIRRGKPDAGFALFESESLKWPGFVEFDDVNGKVLTFSAQDRWDFDCRISSWNGTMLFWFWFWQFHLICSMLVYTRCLTLKIIRCCILYQIGMSKKLKSGQSLSFSLSLTHTHTFWSMHPLFSMNCLVGNFDRLVIHNWIVCIISDEQPNF